MMKLNLKKMKTPMRVSLVIICLLLVGAVVVGILNATVADGKITFGWVDYRYENASQYEIGEGTVYAEEITSIAIDWLQGDVSIVACEDRFISVTEQSSGELSESARVHWCVSEDGKTLDIRCRKSSWFFGSGSVEKKLIVRIPEKMYAQLKDLSVTTDQASVLVRDVDFPTVAITSEDGNIIFDNDRCPDTLAMSTARGNVTLRLPADASFTLQLDEKSKLSTDLSMSQNGTTYVAGAGESRFSVTASKGEVVISVKR